jgi:hypothetical protein
MKCRAGSRGYRLVDINLLISINISSRLLSHDLGTMVSMDLILVFLLCC